MKISVQLPDGTFTAVAGGFNPLLPSMPVNFEFMDDTGASIMQLNQSDLQYLLSINRDPQAILPPLPPLLGLSDIRLADGTINYNICRRFEVNMWDPTTRNYLSNLWHPVQAIILNDNNRPQQLRLNGPWARHRMFAASAPDGSGYTYFSDVHPASSMIVPAVNPVQIPPYLPDLPLLPVQVAGGKAAGGKATGGKATGGGAAGGAGGGGGGAGGAGGGGANGTGANGTGP